LNKKFTYLVFSILLTISGFAQNAAWFDADIGLLRNHEGFFKLFDGVVDVGAGYHFPLIKQLDGGIAFHMGVLAYRNTPSRAMIYKPQLNLNYFVHITSRFAIVPEVHGGYSFIGLSNKEYNYTEAQSGLNAGGQLKCLWVTDKKLDYYLFGRYDFIHLSKDPDFTHLEYYRKMNLFSFGLGLRFKSGFYE